MSNSNQDEVLKQANGSK